MIEHDSESRFRLSPSIVPANSESVLRVSPTGTGDPFLEDSSLDISLKAMEHREVSAAFDAPARVRWRRVGESIEIRAFFAAEQEYTIRLHTGSGTEAQTQVLHLYAFGGDLLHLRPWKGDMHMHSNRSDGRDSPADVAAACRRIGLDFMAVTDHRLYEPSLEAIRAFETAPIDLSIFPGEEIHPPGNPIHIINFGGRESVNALFETSSYRDEVDRLVTSMRRDELRPGVDPYFHASFDAFELIGGYHIDETESNHLQVLRYMEERASGNEFPVVGVSDAHGCRTGELSGWYYSIVFSETTERTDLHEAIRNRRSVAVEHLPGTAPRAYSPIRFAQYSQFLLREVLPDHDRICIPEGEAMAHFLTGKPGAHEQLASLRGGVNDYFARCYGER
jgi:hypothetical protein